MFTGQYPSIHKTVGTSPHFNPEVKPLAQLLSEEGYTTLGFSNSHHTSAEQGFDAGFDRYHDLRRLPNIRGNTYEFSRDYYKYVFRYFINGYDQSYFQAKKLTSWVESASEPFFAFINLNSPHSPYDPPEQYKREALNDYSNNYEKYVVEQLSRDGYRYVSGDLDTTEREWEVIKRLYDGEIRYVDSIVEMILEELNEITNLDNTIVAVTSDHGEQFGENGLIYHQFSLSDVLLEIPLIIRWDKNRNTDSEGLISLVDLLPTFVEAAGGEVPDNVQGRSLLSASAPESVCAEYGFPYPPLRERMRQYGDYKRFHKGLQAAVSSKYKLIRDTNGKDKLYNRECDEIIGSDDYPKEMKLLEERIENTLQDIIDHKDSEGPPEHVQDHLKKMGYM